MFSGNVQARCCKDPSESRQWLSLELPTWESQSVPKPHNSLTCPFFMALVCAVSRANFVVVLRFETATRRKKLSLRLLLKSSDFLLHLFYVLKSVEMYIRYL